jgi:FtsZ-interacting cell division protein YlmF
MTENPTTETADYDDADGSSPDRPGPARATEDYDDDPPGPQAAAEGADEAESEDRDDERPGRREARYRRERNEARAQVEALEQRVENLVAREVARIASDTLEDGFDLIVFMPGDYSDMVDQYGAVDAERVTEYAQQLVQWKPGLAKGARVPTPGFGQGRRTPADQGSGVTWGSVLRGR